MRVFEILNEGLSIADYLKFNDISKADCVNAVQRVRASQEYKALVKDGYTDISTNAQVSKATFAFEKEIEEYNPTIKQNQKVLLDFTIQSHRMVRFKRRRAGIWSDLSSVSSNVKGDKVQTMVDNILSGFKTMVEKVTKLEDTSSKAKDKDDDLNFQQPKGYDISFSSKQSVVLRKSKDANYKFEYIGNKKWNSVSVKVRNGNIAFPPNLIKWKAAPSSLNIIFDSIVKKPDLTNLPSGCNLSMTNIGSLTIEQIKELKPNISISIYCNLIRITDVDINFLKFLKAGYLIRVLTLHDRDLSVALNDKYERLFNDKTSSIIDKMMEFQEWLIDNNLENLAK